MTAAAAPALSALDVACGIVFDPRPRPGPLPAADGSPQDALEAAVLAALRRPPCLVSFSGGRDSSLVLAAAAHVARREGLAPPIPATNRFAGVPQADETRWQEQVVAHLGLADWQRVELTDELDAIGPYAQRLLRAHGLLWPFNVHFHAPLVEAARGGALLTGLGGDDLLAAARRRPAAASRPRALARALLQRSPRRVRAAVIARRTPLPFPWLLPSGRRAATRAMAAEAAAGPRGPLAARMAFALGARYLRLARESLAVCATADDVLLEHPLCAPELWSAVAAAGAGRRGFDDDERLLSGLFGDLLPGALAARADKASFDPVFWQRHSRAFAREWDGSGIPRELVDGDALAAHWRSGAPLPQSLTLLQAAWLAAAGADG